MIATELRNWLEGIAQGDFLNTPFNAGVLAFIVCPMGSSSSAKGMYSFASMSSGTAAVNLGGAFAFNYVNNGATNSYSY